MRILATIAALLFTVQWAAAQNAKVIEAEVIAELNFARTEPQRYATERLEPLLKRFESDKLSYVNSEGDRMMTSEGVDAVVEAIAEMKKATPCGKLTANPNLTKMAQAFATDLGKNGITGHVDSRGNGMNARKPQRHRHRPLAHCGRRGSKPRASQGHHDAQVHRCRRRLCHTH